MPADSRFYFVIVASVALGAMPCSAAESVAPSASPFLPATAPAASAVAPAGGLEFTAVLGEGKKTSVALYDPQTKKSRWISVGSESDGIAVLSYDATRSQVSIRTRGVEQRLSLRPERGVVSGTMVLSAPSTSTATATMAATRANSTKPAPLIAPPAVSKEQEDARLLVSDLLEIGMEQRKAYEAAQKKAAEPAKTVTKAPAR